MVRLADAYLTQGGINTTEGDVAHGADVARVAFGVDGTGVQAGAMSDSVDELANLQASGDLPPGVTVLPGQSGNPGTSEGTALLEIVFAMAPGADLFFATGIGGQAQMAQNILDLAAAGCDVIVDDIGYFAEPVFQDGVIAQAVDAVAAAGVLYFSAAGNSGNLNDGTSGVWEPAGGGAVRGRRPLPPPQHPPRAARVRDRQSDLRPRGGRGCAGGRRGRRRGRRRRAVHRLFPAVSVPFAQATFRSFAFDIEELGFDRDSGGGIMMGTPSLEGIFTDGFESGDTSSWSSQRP